MKNGILEICLFERHFLTFTTYLAFNNEEIVVIEVLDSATYFYDKVAGVFTPNEGVVFTPSEGVCRINMHRNQKLTKSYIEKKISRH